MRQNIIVVDDFHDNPEEVRNFALNAKFPDPGDDYTYPGRNSEDSYYSEQIHRKFENLVREPLIPADKNGYFRLSLENVSHKQDVHVDPSFEWGAVLYMSDPKDCVDEGGTSFWRHNSLDIEHIPKTDEEAQHHGWPTYRECWSTMVYGDGLDRDKWTRHFLCPMKYNRLVLFRTHLWHSHNYNFGDTLENGRMVQLFFFNPIKEW